MMSNTVNVNSESRSHRLRNAIIIAFLLVSLALMFGIMLTNFNRTYQSSRDDVIELSKSSSAKNAEKIELFFTRHEDILLATSEVLDIMISNGGVNEAELKTLLRDLSDEYNENIYRRYVDNDFSGIYLSLGGKMIHAYNGDDDLPEGYDPTKRPWYIEGKSGKGEVVFGEPYQDIYNPEIQVMSVTKLLSDGETVVGMDITQDDMLYASGDMDLSVSINGKSHKYGYGIVLTGNGIVVAHKDQAELEKDYNDESNPNHDLFLKVKQCVKNNVNFLSAYIDGVNYGIFPHKLVNGWYVVTLTDLEDIKTTISEFAKISLVGTGFVIILGLAYGFFILKAYVKAEKLTTNLRDALKLARIDPLTNLGNRTAYDMRIRELKEKAQRDDAPFVLIMMDLNELKYINDHYGHSAGDEYINNCCSLISSIFPCDIYRIGGDEFVLILSDEAYDSWELLFDELKKTIAEANIDLVPSVEKPSIAVGLATHVVGCNDIDAIIRKADAEMYLNKVAIKQARLEHSEKGYTEDVKMKLMDKQILASELRKGLDEEQFEVWFQPQVNHDNNGALVGSEALVRWRHPTRGLVSPAIFIPLFEYNGLIYELDKYVWKHTCECVRRWIDEGITSVPVSVNVSRLDIIQEDFVETITSFATEYEIPIDLLHLEVTESAFGDDTVKITEIVKDLKKRGFTIAIDDFGSGYSSLSLLRNVPANIIKLDMRFFADGENQARNDCIVESIIRMAKMLGMAVFAEGVEKVEQADRLRMLGCTYIQGYLYSRPLPYNEFVEYAKKVDDEFIDSTDGNVKQTVNVPALPSDRLYHNIIAGTNDVIVVSDRKTKQLLYANRAAESFFGKRFDPLVPITCSEYCDRGDLCEKCPAKDLKLNERRESVSIQKGCHIKSLYIQMDWNGHDAIVHYQTDISTEMYKVEYANSLMNNLGVGIVIFRGEAPNELKPIFCNKEYLDLSGLTEENYKTVLNKDSSYGVHPDDIVNARNLFLEAFKNDEPMQNNMRVLKANGGYEWVSVFAKIKRFEDGCFEVYMIFSDAEAEMRKRAIEYERYEKHIIRIAKRVGRSLSLVHINLTKNICHSIHREISVDNPAVLNKTLEDFLNSVVHNVAKEEYQREFMNRFNLSTLIVNYESGQFMDEVRIPIRLSDHRIIWCNQTVNISKNPNTGDLEAVMSLNEDDRDIRLAEHYNRLINEAYEFVANIDVESGLLTVLSEPTDRGLTLFANGKAVTYMDSLVARMNALIDDNYVDACIEALKFETILKNLRDKEAYSCTFPAKEALIGKGVAFEWSFYFVDESKKEILFSRRVIKGLNGLIDS